MPGTEDFEVFDQWVEVLPTDQVVAERGELPKPLARIHPAFRTPHVAIFTCSVVSLGVGLAGTFAAASTLSAIGRLVVYAVTCAALLVLRQRAQQPAGFVLPGGPFFAVFGITFSVWLLSTRSFAQAWIIGAIIFAGVIVRGSMRGRSAAVPPPTT